MRFVAVLILVLLAAGPVQAADKNGSFGILGSGTQSCGNYVETPTSSTHDLAYVAWTVGYLTAYNRSEPDTYNILGSSDLDGAMVWLKNYCKEHPLERFVSAVHYLTIELHPKRTRIKPN